MATLHSTLSSSSSSTPVKELDEKNQGGIAWAGSLVGSQNVSSLLGYRYSTPAKRYRSATTTTGNNPSQRTLPSNIQIRLKDRKGIEISETLDVPTSSTVDELTALLHSLLEQESSKEDTATAFLGKLPYAFYAQVPHASHSSVLDDVEVTSSLVDLFVQHTSLSTEVVLQLTYQPLSVFRVRPVSRCTDTLPGHTEAILHVSYAPNGKLLTSGGGDAMVRFWDVHTSMPKFTNKTHQSNNYNIGHTHPVLCTAWSPDALRFVSGDQSGVLIVWDPATGTPMGSSSGGDSNTTNGSVKQKWKAHAQWITAIAFEPLHSSSSHQCDRIATSSKDSTVKVWNVVTRRNLFILSGHTDSVEALRWGGENLLYSASRDRTIKVWNPHRGVLVRTLIGHGHRVNTLALSTDFVLRTGPFDHQNAQFASSEAAYEAACRKYNDFVSSTGGVERERLVSGSDDCTLFLWHPLQSKQPVKRLTGHQQAVNQISFAPDARHFASASFDKKVKVWNGFSGEFLCTLTGHVGAVYQVSWSGDSRYLVSASKDSTAKLWEMPNGKRARATLPGHADEVYALDWSPYGGSVATGSKDRTIKIWKH